MLKGVADLQVQKTQSWGSKLESKLEFANTPSRRSSRSSKCITSIFIFVSIFNWCFFLVLCLSSFIVTVLSLFLFLFIVVIFVSVSFMLLSCLSITVCLFWCCFVYRFLSLSLDAFFLLYCFLSYFIVSYFWSCSYCFCSIVVLPSLTFKTTKSRWFRATKTNGAFTSQTQPCCTILPLDIGIFLAVGTWSVRPVARPIKLIYRFNPEYTQGCHWNHQWPFAGFWIESFRSICFNKYLDTLTRTLGKKTHLLPTMKPLLLWKLPKSTRCTCQNRNVAWCQILTGNPRCAVWHQK